MKKVFGILVAALLICSCAPSKKLIYLQDVTADSTMKVTNYPQVIIQPQDILSIFVSSRMTDLATPFNLQGGKDTGYTVDSKGDIDFPILGKIHVAGMTREQLGVQIKADLIKEEYITDPIVTVGFKNFKVYITGEVSHPGSYTIESDHISIFEAIAMAGDLSIQGKRNNVKIIREKDGQRTIYEVDLRSARVFDSPAYFLQQNDLVYVEPNAFKMRQTNNSNQYTSPGLWISIISFITSMTLLIMR